MTQAIQGKALKYLEIGYQQELTYRHVDGSFSAFGMSDPNGSTWRVEITLSFIPKDNAVVIITDFFTFQYYRLTAFVAKSFAQAAEHITIEDRVIREALQWLAANQAPSGSFPEVGKVSHRDMQGGAAKGLALTAYTLIAFLENQVRNGIFSNLILKFPEGKH